MLSLANDATHDLLAVSTRAVQALREEPDLPDLLDLALQAHRAKAVAMATHSSQAYDSVAATLRALGMPHQYKQLLDNHLFCLHLVIPGHGAPSFLPSQLF